MIAELAPSIRSKPTRSYCWWLRRVTVNDCNQSNCCRLHKWMIVVGKAPSLGVTTNYESAENDSDAGRERASQRRRGAASLLFVAIHSLVFLQWEMGETVESHGPPRVMPQGDVDLWEYPLPMTPCSARWCNAGDLLVEMQWESPLWILFLAIQPQLLDAQFIRPMLLPAWSRYLSEIWVLSNWDTPKSLVVSHS